ncbi:MAG TPA: hypothetical protein VE197_14855, partial [Mycobacterium sp.]|nr:hypothetical protein [Mycobacterium sp.]
LVTNDPSSTTFLDNLNEDTTYMWHYLADKNGIGHQAIDEVADQLAKLIENCPSPQRLRE